LESESITMPSRRGAAVFLLFLTCFTMFLLIGRSLAAEAERAPLALTSTRVQGDESVQIAYIVRRSSADNSAVTQFLTANGFAVDLLPLGGNGYSIYLPLITGSSPAPRSGAAAAATTQDVSELPDLSVYDLVLIGADTGSGATWMAGLPGLANGLASSGLPIMGLGAGGNAFFGKLGLEIGHPNGTAVSAANVTVADWGDSHDLYATPNGIDVPQNRILALFDSQQPGIALTLDQPPLAGLRIAAVDNGGYPVAAEDDNKLLWGFDVPVSALTADGEALLLNSLWYLVRELTVSLPSGDITPSRGIEAELLDALAATSAPQLHALLQLNSLPTPAEEAALQTAGVTLLGYLGGTTYKTAVSTAFEADDPSVTALVRWGGLLQPVDKMPPKLAAGQFEEWAINGDGTINVIATLHSDMSTAEMRTLLDDYDDGAERDGSFSFRMQLLPAQINALADEDEVVWIEEGPEPVELTNDRGRFEMYVDEAQDLDLSEGLINYRGVSGQGINVGIFDTGVTSDTFSHPDFAGRLLREKFDNNSHGTHVAGIVGGSGADSNNLRLRGMAPEAGLIPYNLNPFWDATRMREALITYEMDVSNHSYTHGCGGYGSQARNADELVRGDLVYRGGSSPIALPGHLYVSAAGNQGRSAQWCRTAALPGSPTLNDPTMIRRAVCAAIMRSPIQVKTRWSSARWSPTAICACRPAAAVDRHGMAGSNQTLWPMAP